MSGKIIEINEQKVKEHLGEFVRSTVEETLNSIVDPKNWTAKIVC